MPVEWSVLLDVVGRMSDSIYGSINSDPPSRLNDQSLLNDILTSLEDRGLMGWDRTTNRYDLHPVVRLSVWNATPVSSRQTIMESVFGHYSDQLADEVLSGGPGSLNTQIEYFYTLNALGRFDESYNFFKRSLHELTLHAESQVRLHLELIQQFFPNGVQEAPAFQDARQRSLLHRWLTYAYTMVGEPGAAVEFTFGTLRPQWASSTRPNWRDLYFALAECGRLRESEAALGLIFLRHDSWASAVAQRSVLPWLAYQLDCRGEFELADRCAARLSELAEDGFSRGNLVASSPTTARRLSRDRLLSAARLLERGNVEAAVDLLDRSESLVYKIGRVRERMRFLQLRGRAYREQGRTGGSQESLEEALLLARSYGVVGMEMPCLVELAKLSRDVGRVAEASQFLRDVFEPAARGPYPIDEADARVVMAELALESGRHDVAVAEASLAYSKAWCDGPPYSYSRGLREAESVLSHCGAEVPSMRPYDPSRFLKLPQVLVAEAKSFEIGVVLPSRGLTVSEPLGVNYDDSDALGSFIAIGTSFVARTPTAIVVSGDD
jgi:tetratricopeptide (TPR) repeat protein